MAPIPGSAPLLAEVLLVYSSLYLISSFTGCRGTVLLDSITGLPVIERSRWKMCVKSLAVLPISFHGTSGLRMNRENTA
jgi:hypothetical protein